MPSAPLSSSDALSEALLETFFPSIGKANTDAASEETPSDDWIEAWLHSTSPPTESCPSEEQRTHTTSPYPASPDSQREATRHKEITPSPGSSPESAHGLATSPSPQRRVVPQGRTLDPIDQDLVGQVNSKRLIDQLLGSSQPCPDWLNLLRVTMQGSSAAWCGRNKRTWDRVRNPHTCEAGYFRLISQLAGSVLAEGGPSKNFFTAPGRVTIFTVHKDMDKLRLIANCVELNKLFGNPPRLNFPSISEIFMIISFFRHDTFFTTADFRHWFYQLSLPRSQRRYFSLLANRTSYHFTVWVMGFSWSPFIAQAHSMGIAKLAIDDLGHYGLFAVHPRPAADELPPFWIVSKRKDPIQHQKRDDIAAFVLFWYDNLLIVANSRNLRDTLQDAIVTTARRFSAKWKVSTEVAPKGFTDGSEAFSPSTDKVQFLGLDFSLRNGSLFWSHAAHSVDRWQSLLSRVQSTSLNHRRFLDAASLCGIIIRDWAVKNEQRYHIYDIIGICQTLGRLNLSRKEFKRRAEHIKQNDWEALFLSAHARCTTAERQARLNSPYSCQRRIFVAADACEDAGAVVDLSSGATIFSTAFVGTWFEKHITRKEAFTAIHAGLTILETRQTQNTLIVILVDNIAAAAVINRRTCVFDKEIDNLVVHLWDTAEEKGAHVLAIYIPGEMQPADEQSRGDLTKPQKCRKAIRYAIDALQNFFEVLYFTKPHQASSYTPCSYAKSNCL